MEIIWLQRSTVDTPWGFRLQGGRGSGLPLSVQRVNPGSVASSSTLTSGDILLKINNQTVTNYSHAEGQQLINQAGNLLQLTIKKQGIVAASCPVSPTPMSQSSVSFTAPTSPISLRGFSPVSDGLPSFRSVYTDDEFDNPRYFASLPRHASISGVSYGTHQNSHTDSYDPHGRKNSAPYGAGSFTMPKPTPYRPSTGNMSTSHGRSGSDSSGYQTSSYGPSPNTFDSPVSSQQEYSSSPQRPQAPTPYKQSTMPYKPQQAPYSYGPGPGIAPPSYESSLQERERNMDAVSSMPGYQRQQSFNRSNSDAYASHDSPSVSSQHQSERSNMHRSFDNSRTYSPLDRQSSREATTHRHNAGEQSSVSEYTPYQQKADTQPGGYHRQQSSGYQRQPSFGSTPQSPAFDIGSPSSYRRQNSQSSNVNFDNTPPTPPPPPPRGYERQDSTGSTRGRKAGAVLQRQTSAGSYPKTKIFESTVSSPTYPSASYVNNEYDGKSTGTYEKPMSPVSTKSSHSGINSFEDILSPFDKFPNYYNEFISKSNEPRANGNVSVVPEISDNSRSNFKSPPPFNSSTENVRKPSTSQTQTVNNMYNSDRPSQQAMWRPEVQYDPRQFYNDQQNSPYQTVSSPMSPPPVIPPPPTAPSGPTPPPPPPPPPPAPPLPSQGWTPPKRPVYRSQDNEMRTPGDGSPVQGYGQEHKMPDAVLNQMIKQGKSGTPKPFAYITGGIDLKEFKNRKNRPPPPVMPKAYKGPNLNGDPVPPPQQQQQRQQQRDPQQPHFYQPRSPQPYLQQVQPPLPPVRSSSGYAEAKPIKDIEKSAVYQMIQESENPGMYERQSPVRQRSSPIRQRSLESPSTPQSPPVNQFVKPQSKHGLSFKVLQWMTSLDDEEQDELEDVSQTQDIIDSRQRRNKDPTLRHNAEDDEMRFSGLHSKKDIPSKTFARLNQMTLNDEGTQQQPQQSNNYQEEENEDERIGKYDQGSIRYTGKHIPSPSFRVLQHWAEYDESKETQNGKTQPAAPQSDDDILDGTDDGMPDTLDEEVTDKRYMGANIPSRSFKMLQMSIGKGENEQNAKKYEAAEEASKHPEPAPAPAPTVQSGPRKLQIVTKSRAVPTTDDEPPSTDF